MDPAYPPRQKSTQEREDQDLRIIKSLGGFSETEWENKEEIEKIELVIEDVATLNSFRYFTGLKELYLLHCYIEKIEGLDKMEELHSLWLSENEIKRIEGLGNLVNLKKLNLHCNKIQSIQNLEKLENLEVLILSENNISEVKNLEKLQKLRELNLAMNAIQVIGNSLMKLESLEEINLSGNKICSINEIMKLKKIKSLKIISFFDPHFGENPICKIYNYQTFMLYHFNHLKKFDNLIVNEESKKCAEIEFKKKKIYYNMKIKALKRFFITLKKVLRSAKEARKEVIDQGIKLMQKFMSLVDSTLSTVKTKATKIYEIKAEESAYLDLAYDKAVEFMQRELDKHIYFISKELDSTGNFKLEEGGKGDRWFQSCINLVKSRFYPEDLEKYNINGLNVYRVLRIHNRFLRNRFEERIELYLDQANPHYKKSFEYLFYGVDPEFPDEFWKVLEYGYKSSGDCKKKGICPYFPLVNSVVAADKPRIQDFFYKKWMERKQAKFGKVLENFNFKISQGVLLVCKVIIIRPQQDPRFPNFDIDKSFSKTYKQFPIDNSLLNSDIIASFRECKEDARHKVWFIHDNTLVLPEYLIYFDYETKPTLELKPKYDSYYLGNTLLTSLDPELKFAKPYNDKESVESIEHALKVSVKEIKKRHKHHFNDKENMSIGLFDLQEIARSGIKFMKLHILNFMLLCAAEDPEIKTFKEKIGVFQEMKKIEEFSEDDHDKLSIVNMSSYELEELPELGKFRNLLHVDVSFNKITNLNFLKGLSTLEKLSLAGNNLSELSDLSHMMRLFELDVSFNKFKDINNLKMLSRNPKLVFLKIRGNSFCKRFSKLPEVILKLIPNIENLDDNDLLTLKYSLKQNSGETVTYTMISNYLKEKQLNLNQLVSINLKKQNIINFGEIEKMPLVKKLNLSWNRLTAIEGLSAFPNLESLNIEHNFLINIDELEKVPTLIKLELGSNKISKIGDVFSNLRKLTHLSIEDNRIESLAGLKPLNKLLELYIGENFVADLKQIRHLSNLKKLIVVDMWGNPLCKEYDYRLYVVYHIKDVKVLDGTSISQAEYEESKEAFTGRLSEELLQMKLKNQNLKTIESMDLSRCKLRDFDAIFTSEKFPLVQEINVTGNHFTCFKGFKNMSNLKILIIADNRLNSFEPIVDPSYKIGLNGIKNIEMLDISRNKFTSIDSLKYFKLSRLYVLKAGNNHIRSISGISHLNSLRDIDLSGNRVKTIEPNSFNPNMKLKYLCLDENFIKSFNNLAYATRLQHLFIRYNKCSEFSEIEGLKELPNLKELEITNNPLSRKHGYRYNILQRLHGIIYLDGAEVSHDERQRIDIAMQHEMSKYNLMKNNGYSGGGQKVINKMMM